MVMSVTDERDAHSRREHVLLRLAHVPTRMHQRLCTQSSTEPRSYLFSSSQFQPGLPSRSRSARVHDRVWTQADHTPSMSRLDGFVYT
jgi:hypothetical protein